MSSYRDERAALQERVGVLEEDLRDAREQAGKVDGLARDVSAKEKEIGKLRARLAEHEGPPKPRGSGAVPAIALAAVAIVGAAGYWLLHRPTAAPLVAAPAVGAAPADVAPGDELPEPCNSYLKEIERCVATHPDMAALRDTAGQQREAFKAGLAVSASRQPVLDACGKSLEALRTACK